MLLNSLQEDHEKSAGRTIGCAIRVVIYSRNLRVTPALCLLHFTWKSKSNPLGFCCKLLEFAK